MRDCQQQMQTYCVSVCRDAKTRYSNGSAAVAAAEADEELDNPFQADGELRRKADYIITHSRISRTEIQIADPDSPDLVPSGNAEVNGARVLDH